MDWPKTAFQPMQPTYCSCLHESLHLVQMRTLAVAFPHVTQSRVQGKPYLDAGYHCGNHRHASRFHSFRGSQFCPSGGTGLAGNHPYRSRTTANDNDGFRDQDDRAN